MGDILYSFNNMRRNLSIYLKWISIFSLVQIAILLPLFSYFFFLILHLAGVQSLNDNNLFDIFGMPVILSLLIVLVLAFLFIFITKSAFLFCSPITFKIRFPLH
ncbi:Membrane domain of membrane-anchored glycerophosphoryl diester phosphodiesterase [Listeria fleischmannii subsp. fleischmannii]|uniref:Membrane domain of membrane-anchored glycerophosphoryl diester phosphodiesterase n=1 Tax=Listeria fleischmannii subsp. fleischmannii TaxID=1671902 RepID=A0A2X3H850_9LIST|nr:glycerophosphoryl diester phosphodiesterase membrane domain-containing protein [Listeria fleischmannii]SQC68667.1 Membrane domain of membrane-anchored glycerophosphoryl diester phosphodiesterase [Listeria fleischmannii subsp. fleischmannii]